MKLPPHEARQILKQRARTLARPVQIAAPRETLLELLEFRLAREQYAVETRHVHEVHPLRGLTSLPGTPDFLLGIVSVRSRVLPVFDLKRLFGLPKQGLDDLHHIVHVKCSDIELGLLADVIVGVRHVPAESLQGSLPALSGIHTDYIKGVADQRLIVIDLDRVLADPKIIIDQDIDSIPSS